MDHSETADPWFLLGSTLAAHDTALFALDEAGRGRAANPVAEVVLMRDDGLHLRAGRLAARDPGADAQLQAALAQVLGASGEAPLLTSPVILARQATGHYQLRAHWHPRRTARRSRSLAFVTCAHAPEVGPRAGWEQRYQLSTAEAEVCRLLCAGLRPAEIAARRGTSPETVRTQLKHIYQKCKVRDRVALLRRLHLED